jgi:sugar/nucleoside kinase (ribokinase family)
VTAATPDLVCVGNFVVDDIVYADGRCRSAQPGGSVLYEALGARLWGANVGVVSIAGTDYPARTLKALETRGVDVAGVRSIETPGLCNWLLYEKRGRQIIRHLDSPRHEAVSPTPAQLPPHFSGARGWLIGPMPIERQLEWVSHLESGGDKFVAVDPHRRVEAGSLDAWREVLARADAFFPSHEEVDLENAASGPLAALGALSDRLRFVALKRASRGGTLLDARKRETIDWSAASETVVDSTGAGDAFAGAFVAAWLASGDVPAALNRARVAAGVAIENWGALGFFSLSNEMAAQRLHAIESSPHNAAARAIGHS